MILEQKYVQYIYFHVKSRQIWKLVTQETPIYMIGNQVFKDMTHIRLVKLLSL